MMPGLGPGMPGMVNKKTSMDCSGGGFSTRIKRPTLTERMYKAYQVVAINRDSIEVWKNRYGSHGKISVDELIEFVSDMLVRAKFKNSMDMFQETMKMKIIEELTKIINDENIIPEGEIENENTVQRESGDNGIRHNSLLQRFVSLCR